MKDLKDLLSQVDAWAPPPPPPRDLAARVRKVARRNSRIKSSTAAVVGFVAIGVTLISMLPSHQQLAQRPQGPTTTALDSRQLQTELADLEMTAVAHERIARQLISAEAASRPGDELPALDPLAQIGAERDRAARILVRDADLRLGQPGQEARAIEAYRTALRLFPNSPAAKDAARHLKNAGV